MYGHKIILSKCGLINIQFHFKSLTIGLTLKGKNINKLRELFLILSTEQ